MLNLMNSLIDPTSFPSLGLLEGYYPIFPAASPRTNSVESATAKSTVQSGLGIKARPQILVYFYIYSLQQASEFTFQAYPQGQKVLSEAERLTFFVYSVFKDQ